MRQICFGYKLLGMMGLRFIFSESPLTSFSGNRRTPWALAEVELDGDGFAAATELLHEFVALEPAVDHFGGCAGVLHVEDDFGTGAEGSAVVDEFVAIAFDEAGGVAINTNVESACPGRVSGL